ncbi:aminotransferase class I/II-fold pyridoxal phosphate-dependent enzyme [Anaerocolumna sedimenticola]|uniref:Aminotransferase class I/II-fold pyridoxal phosphate-dependent enzyme n=1 Tax=Anaerocolumna sedimenticola TaxID=2696063 RepID=A0A6P1TT33_9FIRM|nr:PLP-dependent aminotransferase family protein [Anaerocolumna sedimenticola]QHQ63369.1 aminotransferase class I/II-fold pyridoxal phosphate-dependent enzyme [Anaerocolumna sedimenticola]
MPVNSFDDYPMTWRPNRAMLKFPIYISLAELLEQDILNHRIYPNTKLPPQRELADYLDVNLSTITRAFKLCETKGLIYATIGKGTFVSPNAALSNTYMREEGDFIELGSIQPYYQFNAIVTETARAILQRKQSEKLFEFGYTLGQSHHRQIAQKWLLNFQIDVLAENIILTSGTQNALLITLLSLFKAGDKIATDIFTYSNFISLARQLNIQLIPIASDRQGMLPDELEKQSRLLDIKGIYLMPSCTNPTGVAMPLERRKAISSVISKQEMLLIEDDTYGFIMDDKINPMMTLIPENTVYVHGLSKSLSAGLRIAYLVVPYHLQQIFIKTTNNINLKIPLLNAEIMSELIASGSACEIINKKCMLSEERNKLYSKYFKVNTSVNPYSFFHWLWLPAGVNGYNFEMQAETRGVRILCSDRFAVGNTSGISAIRVATCSPATIYELERGLQIIQKLIEENQTVI